MQKKNKSLELAGLCLLVGLGLLALHFYNSCPAAFQEWKLTVPFLDRLVTNLTHSRPLKNPMTAKLAALFMLIVASVISPAGTGGGPTSWMTIGIPISIGAACYLLGDEVSLYLSDDRKTIALIYITLSLAGAGLLAMAARAIGSGLQLHSSTEVFNTYNESFPQEERRLTNAHSVNLKARYQFRGRTRSSWISMVNIFAGTLIVGRPGSGKTRFIFRQFIQQNLEKGMAMFVFDHKFDDLSRIAYNTFLKVSSRLAVRPKFYVINFEDYSRSHRCNPLDPSGMNDISDASEAARTILYAINRDWSRTQSDFFVTSAIEFFTANIWFLRKYENGKYCTLPHLIELIQTDYNQLFSILQSYPETATRIHSFLTAYQEHTMEQLQGQVDSARIPLTALASPQLYYLLSANDFTLDINNPKAPKVVCCGSNPQKHLVYGAVISLYVARMIKLVNKKGGIPCALHFDEFASFYSNGMDNLLATCRSNKVAPVIGIQDISQLRKEYGRDQADALFNLPGNVICGQTSGDTARLMSERFGKILQRKESVSTNERGNSTSESQQLELAVPASKIVTLSSGEFVGMVTDTPGQKIRLKAFHSEIVVDHKAIDREQANSVDLPVIRTVTAATVDDNYNAIRNDVKQIISRQLARMMQTPDLAKLIIVKKWGKGHSRQPGP